MKTATTRELRNDFARLSRLLEEGEQIEITKRGQPFALLTLRRLRTSKKARLPDFAARLKSYMDAPLPAGSSESVMDYERGDR